MAGKSPVTMILGVAAIISSYLMVRDLFQRLVTKIPKIAKLERDAAHSNCLTPVRICPEGKPFMILL